MVGSLLLAVALHGVDRPLQPMLEPHAVAPDENRTAGRHEGRSSLYAASESYYSGELECPVGCFAQPVRDDHAGIMRHHLNKAEDLEDTAEESAGENRTDSYKAMYKEIQVRHCTQLASTLTLTRALTLILTLTLTPFPLSTDPTQTQTQALTRTRSCTWSSRGGTT